MTPLTLHAGKEFQPPVTERHLEAEVTHCVGGVASPVLSNVYLDRLDQFVEQSLLPEYNRGPRRQPNRAYRTVEFARARRRGDREAVRALGLQRRSLPSQDPNDPDYRRLRYVHYADDWLLGFAGPKHEAEEITSKIGAFLRDELKLELSESKTVITHATSQAAHFLGYEIRAQHPDTKITRNRRAVNGAIGLFVPRQVIRQKCALYMSKGQPAQRGILLHDEDFTIVAKYQAEYRGLVQYYLLAQDVFRLGRLQWVMETSLLKTLAGKHRSTVTKMARKYKSTVETPEGPRTCLTVTVPRDRERSPGAGRARLRPSQELAGPRQGPHRPEVGDHPGEGPAGPDEPRSLPLTDDLHRSHPPVTSPSIENPAHTRPVTCNFTMHTAH
ncbi:reverse transcriptase domain-containing protein [Streptomyces europaeiscabiei]|nr:reverse transcriptase domain-containing protein [Streptomyces europaeiscabiei]